MAGAVGFGLTGALTAYSALRARERHDVRAAATPSSVNADLPRPGAERELERMRGELALVQGQLLALRDRVNEQKAPADAAVVPEDPEALDPETLQKEREASTRRWKEHMVEVATAFEQEALDRGFATTMKDAVDRAMQSDPVIQKVAGKVDCRSRTCRVEIHDAKSSEVSQQLPGFLRAVGGSLRRAQADYVDGNNGQKTVVLYLTNEEPAAPVPGR